MVIDAERLKEAGDALGEQTNGPDSVRLIDEWLKAREIDHDDLLEFVTEHALGLNGPRPWPAGREELHKLVAMGMVMFCLGWTTHELAKPKIGLQT